MARLKIITLATVALIGAAMLFARKPDQPRPTVVPSNPLPPEDIPALDPQQSAIVDVAKRIASTMKPCDKAYTDYRAKPSKALAEVGAERCLDASGDLGNVGTIIRAEAPQKDDMERILKKCMVSAGARYGWLNGLAYPEANISDGEENAVSQNLACINDMIETAGAAGISADDPRLTLPLYIGA